MISFFKKIFARPRTNFLAFLLFALVIPSIAVLLVAVAGMLSQERAMEAAVSSYVLDLAESMSYHLGSSSEIWSFSMLSDFTRFPFFSWGPSIPGWVALIDSNGRIVIASPGAMNIAAIWREDLPIGQAVKISDAQGSQYTLAIYPVKRAGGGYVVAAVSWQQLLGGLVGIVRVWPFLLMLIALSSFVGIKLLWSKVVNPLKFLVSEIDDMTLGRDVPGKLEKNAVKEIESVHSALRRFAEAAIERDNLRNRYVRDVVQAQEKERVDMAREIHDGPLQDVTALVQQLHMTLDDENNVDIPKIKLSETIAKGVVRELRALCDELAPPWMDLGLIEALTELAERLSQVYDVQVSADFDDDTREIEMEDEKTLSLLRIVQEAVSNAVRHGEATEINIHLRKADDDDEIKNENKTIILEIVDNGCGFDSENINHETLRLEGHRGLASMNERMSLMGGTLKIKSAPGEGTDITAGFKI
ncbi:MAG: sensor histidine kinase [Synergistaceae bacterium]|nr:sensor histidine kinase [Synergistaceae bacterium]